MKRKESLNEIKLKKLAWFEVFILKLIQFTKKWNLDLFIKSTTDKEFSLFSH